MYTLNIMVVILHQRTVHETVFLPKKKNEIKCKKRSSVKHSNLPLAYFIISDHSRNNSYLAAYLNNRLSKSQAKFSLL